MDKLLISFFTMLLYGICAAGESCRYSYSYSIYTNNYHYEYCSYGCCYTDRYPCCTQPITEMTAFIVPVVLVSVFLVVCAIVVIIVIRRRRRLQTTIQYGTTIATPQVVTTTTAGNYYQGGYNNPQFPPGNAYFGQPPNGQMIQTYPAQTVMYQANPSNQEPQMYAGGPPMYTPSGPSDPDTSQTIPQSKE